MSECVSVGASCSGAFRLSSSYQGAWSSSPRASQGPGTKKSLSLELVDLKQPWFNDLTLSFPGEALVFSDALA